MKKGMTKAKITRVESWVNLGIPDCIVGLANKFHLIELKVAAPNGKVKVSAHQVAFHSGHKGYPTWVFVQHEKGRKAKLFVYEGWQSYALAQYGILLPPVLEQSYPWDWEEVEKHLTAFKN
jgi:hypothetical protein